MVRWCRTPSFSRNLFTANELSGWADGIAYSPRQPRKRRKAKSTGKEERAKQTTVVPAVEPVTDLTEL